MINIGLETEFHTAPASRWDPWVGLALALEGVGADRRESGVDVSEFWDGLALRLEGGFQFHRSSKFESGFYGVLGAGVWMSHDVEVGGQTQSAALGQTLHGVALAGVRVAWLP
jgi:hypothetical protein